MGTKKWIMLDHIAISITKVGGDEYLHAEIFENVHQTFERYYKGSFQKMKSVLEEKLGKTIKTANFHRFEELKC